MKIADPKTRQLIFYIGILFIALGSIGILANAPWGNIFNSLFAIFGTTISFAQFSVGFQSLKPEDKSSDAAGPPQTTMPGTTPANGPGAGQQPAKARLVGPSGQLDLRATEVSIGRAPDNHHQAFNDTQVSGHHAVIRPEGQGYVLVDQGSTNGTWVNGQRLEAKKTRILRSGDVIRIGNTTFTYEVAVTPTIPPTVVAPRILVPPPPPDLYSRLGVHYTLSNAQKRYIGSGIAFLFVSLFSLISTPFALVGAKAPLGFLHLVTYILTLCGIRGLYLKQADKAGWLGTAGTLMITAGILVGVLGAFALVILSLSNQQISSEPIQGFETLHSMNFGFLALGEFILGISMIRAAVYPLWTSILLIVISLLNIITFLAPNVMVLNFIAQSLATAVFFGWGMTLLQRLPNRVSR